MTRSSKGFKGVPCVKCGEVDTVRVHVADVSFSCSSCDEEYDASDVRTLVEKWTALLAWMDMIPQD